MLLSRSSAFLVFGAILVITSFGRLSGQTKLPDPLPDRTEVNFKLKRGDFKIYRYHPGNPAFSAHPRAVIVFGSGDGGFSVWEDKVCKALQADGYEMLGFDCARYSDTDYNLPMLQADMATIANSVTAEYGDFPPPVIYGGWSMGAVQAVAAASQSNFRPKRLVGVLVISAGKRGRYGLRPVDRWDVPPTGPGTFALLDFDHQLQPLRIVQWTGSLDPLDSTQWLGTVTTTYKIYHYAYGLHDFDNASDKFLKELDKSIGWILNPPLSEQETD